MVDETGKPDSANDSDMVYFANVMGSHDFDPTQKYPCMYDPELAQLCRSKYLDSVTKSAEKLQDTEINLNHITGPNKQFL